MRKSIPILAVLVAFLMVFMSTPVGAPGATKIDMRDNTDDGLGPGDPDIGFVNYNQNAKGTLIITVSLKGAVAYATLEVQLVVTWTDPVGGINPEPGGHYGLINPLGTITTNEDGNGNAHFNVDVTTLSGTISGTTNYGHIDCEDDDGAVFYPVADYGLVDNQYGGTALEWEQP